MLAWSRGLPVRIRYFPVLCIHISIYDVYIYIYTAIIWAGVFDSLFHVTSMGIP